MSDSNGSTQPLSGVRVLDFTQVMMGPCATQMLADYGADVIKIERPGAGDLSRTSIADDPDGLNNPVFRSLNRNKRSIALDLRGEAGKAIVLDLVKGADVVVNNFRAGVMDRMGFGYEALSKINPRIICAFGSGFGQAGPLSHKGGQDILAQALSGVMARKPDPSLPTTLYATALADYSAGMHLMQGILLALMQREKTGRGQQISVSLYDSMLAMQMQEASMWMARKRELNWGAFPLTGVFETTDGALVIVGAFKANPLQDICRALDLPDLSADPETAQFAGQVKHKAELHRQFRSRISTNTTAYWLARLEEQDLLCAPVQTLADALASEQTSVNGMVVAIDANGSGRNEPLKLVGSPIAMAADAFHLRHAPPSLGEHGAEILGELGYGADRIAELRKAKVLMTVRYAVENHVARVIIDRPDRMNAIDEASEAELIRIWETIEKDNDVRCVVVTGAGERAFCTGADMKQSGNKTGLEYWAATRPGGFGGLSLRDTLDVPVIARVNGHALGGGMEMVLGCDIVVAADNATFGCPEPRVGRLALEGGIAQLPRRIPHVWAMGMLLTGRRISAAEALRFGLVNEVVPQAGLDQAVERWVADVLACAPLSVKAVKQMVRRGAQLSPQEAQMLRVPALIAALNSTDQDEGVQAFVEKRAPQWQGR